ncbi:hypothetical protein [Oryza sativa Japonica Group]|uniref:Uncharacterized protein n=1 Tax=Oryza sativa subsp. japonica TaxID=39947 RepID=Q5VQV8_ORYSJ|nr:hypothetical protein [Oryza sativa Japonica Group]
MNNLAIVVKNNELNLPWRPSSEEKPVMVMNSEQQNYSAGDDAPGRERRQPLALAGGHSSSRSGQTKPTGHQRQFAAVHARSGDDALIGGPRVNDPTRQGLIRRDANEWGMDRREEEAGD